MNKYKEYSKFPDLESAMEYTKILEENDIPFQLDDSAMRFKLDASYDAWDKNYILRIQESDIERAESLFDQQIKREDSVITEDHYLYSFADNDILDIIANQKDWTKEEVKLAIKLANERKIVLSASSIKSVKKTKETEQEFRLTIQNTSIGFWSIAAFSIVNSIMTIRGSDFHLPGLATTEILDNFFLKLYGFGNRVGFISCLIISGVFFLFARYGKKNKWIFLIGVIVYSLDSLLILFSNRWIYILYNSLALWSMITGLVNTIRDNDKIIESNTNA